MKCILTIFDNFWRYFFQYSGLISYFADRAKAMVQSMDPTNELLYLRVTSRYIELLGTILPIWDWQRTFLTTISSEDLVEAFFFFLKLAQFQITFIYLDLCQFTFIYFNLSINYFTPICRSLSFHPSSLSKISPQGRRVRVRYGQVCPWCEPISPVVWPIAPDMVRLINSLTPSSGGVAANVLAIPSAPPTGFLCS